jgi:hypothetical protein
MPVLIDIVDFNRVDEKFKNYVFKQDVIWLK